MTTRSKLPIEWYAGCTTDKEKEARETLVRNSTEFSKVLLMIMSRKYEGIDRKGFKEEDYAEGGWVTLQAFRNGKLAQLTELADLFSHLKG